MWSQHKNNSLIFIIVGFVLLDIYKTVTSVPESTTAGYEWTCSEPNDAGVRYIPNITDRSTHKVASTVGSQLNIYPVKELTNECHGRINRIEYCFKYNTTIEGCVVFNWTVLILKMTTGRSSLKIVNSIAIESHPRENDTMCSEDGRCCDQTEVTNLNLSAPLYFGVTESDRGNTHESTLLGYSDSIPEYMVDTIRLTKSELNLSVNSTIDRRDTNNMAKGGLRMLWFSIGDNATSTQQPTVHCAKAELTTAMMTAEGEITDSLHPDVTTQVVGGVIGCLLAFTAVVVAVVVSLIIYLNYKRSLKKDQATTTYSTSEQMAYHNAVYQETNVRFDAYNEHCEYSKSDELGHKYSVLTSSQCSQGSDAGAPYDTPQTSLNAKIDSAEDIYVVPASDEYSLYSQLSQINIHTFTSDAITLTAVLGSGQFGTVHKGEWVAPGLREKREVAVKTLKEEAGDEDKVKFLQEAAIMGQFSHPNVVQLYGVVTDKQVMLIIELLPQGDLRGVLCNIRSKSNSPLGLDSDLPHTLLSWCRQIASGMCYLAQKAFVHRDLAARNVLVSEDGTCKIADFGMSRDLADTDYYVAHGGIIPVKWTAPEAIHYRKYSTASDVWSFGCVMYEIWSLGHKPFEAYQNQECISIIDGNHRLPPPSGSPRSIYKLMIVCWHPEPSGRLDFVSVVQQLSLPDTRLLKWSEEDKTINPEAVRLGAGLDKAADLYKDLQEQYIN